MSSKMSLMPNISIPRSRFPQDFNHSFDMFHGDIVPVDCFEVVAGDEFNYTLSSLVRMSTPVVPIMGNIKCYVHAFFVPMRLVLNDTEKFFGDPSNHDKVSSITPVDFDSVSIPNILDAYDDNAQFMYSVSDYLGKDDFKPVYTALSGNVTAYKLKVNVSPLKERAYLQIWNDHFRPSLMVPPVIITKTSASAALGTETFTTGTTKAIKYPFPCLKGFKQYDYFTASTLSPQFNTTTVKLPLGLTAPIYLDSTNDLDLQADFAISVAGNGTKKYNLTTGGRAVEIADPSNVVNASMYADLALATSASWNDIRVAAQLQKYYERSNYGSRFFEILNAHYGITNPDSRLQRAERLGSHSFYINVSQVVSTADTVSGSTGQNLGNTGAVSCTGDKIHLFNKSFSEPGYVMVVMTMKYDRSYSSGYLREDLKKNRFEFYSPEFACLGDQGTKKIEIQTMSGDGTGGSADVVDGDDILGYNEHWAEYRYRKNLISGSLRVGATFDVWTLADTFNGSSLTLGYDFLKEDRTALARLLASGVSGPDYIVDTHADIIATRELPLYSIPGRIDHFGAM